MRTRVIVVSAIVVALLIGATTAPAVGEDHTAEDQTVGVTVHTPGLLAIEVEPDVALGIISPGATTGKVAFHMGIVNDTSESWEVHVTATDFESFTRVCDGHGGNCVRTPSDPLQTIAATNLYIHGGMDSAWAGTADLMAGDGHFAASGTPMLLLKGTSATAGTLAIDEPQASMWLDVPGTTPDGEYSATLTYTIMATAP